ncbi:hypothetical protein BDV93DRAFT_596299 [Ceratobasidium sp. AG-I]|nr:hypothetical protein BDV93DRAFT_596299 [Ceratobasidium sp. AG-I]
MTLPSQPDISPTAALGSHYAAGQWSARSTPVRSRHLTQQINLIILNMDSLEVGSALTGSYPMDANRLKPFSRSPNAANESHDSTTPKPRCFGVVNLSNPLVSLVEISKIWTSLTLRVLLSGETEICHLLVEVPYIPRVYAGRGAWYMSETYEFVVGNYQTGDSLLILDTFGSVSSIPHKDRHTAIRHLAAALRLFTQVYGRLSWQKDTDQHVDEMCIPSLLPSTVGNFLCFNGNTNSGSSAYAIERGLYGQIKRKEVGTGHHCYPCVRAWVLLQTSHIIQYSPLKLWDMTSNPKDLLSAVTYSNYTNRRHGLPHDDAISTGGQLVRMAYVTNSSYYGTRWLVWSSQCFAEGEYEAVSRTRPFGPKGMRSKPS